MRTVLFTVRTTRIASGKARYRGHMKNILFSIAALSLLLACSKEPEPSEPVYDLAAGKAIAEADCSACHGMDGRGATFEIPT